MNGVTIKLGFTAEELHARRRYLGGSDANILMSGDGEAVHQLWLRKTGREPEPDLGDVLAVQCGIFTEELSARWFTKVTGRPVSSRNKLRISERYRWMACNLDGLTGAPSNLEPSVFEAKWMGAFTDLDGAVQRYQPQLHHNMLCCDLKRAVLSVITGKPSYELFEIELDEFFAAQLVERERLFWECVERDEAPGGYEPIAAPIPVERMREVDMTSSNSWAMQAGIWIETRADAKRFDGAAKELKALVAADVRLAHGHGIRATRAKNGSITIKGA